MTCASPRCRDGDDTGAAPGIGVDLTVPVAATLPVLGLTARQACHRLDTGDPAFRGRHRHDLAARTSRCRRSTAPPSILLSTEAPVHP